MKALTPAQGNNLSVRSALPELSPQKKQALMALEHSDRQYIEAGLYPPIKKLSQEEFRAGITALIALAYSNCGQAIELTHLNQLANAIVRRLERQFPDVTLEEVRMAFENGIYEKYGPYYGLNPKTFVLFVRNYLADSERTIAKVNYRQRLAARPPIDADAPSPWEFKYWNEESTEKWMSIAEEFYKLFLSNSDAAAFVPQQIYYLLGLKGLIGIDPDQIKELKARAQVRIAESKSFRENDSIAAKIKHLAQAIESGDNSIAEKVGDEARRIAVTDYFARCKASGMQKLFTDKDNAHA